MSFVSKFICKCYLFLLIHIRTFYELVTIGTCRCGEFNYPVHRPFFCDPKFYPSPPKPWLLPSYANDIANQLAKGSYRVFRPKCHQGRALEFLDI